MIRAAPELHRCVNAVMLRADWRPLVGLSPEDVGTLVERVLAEAVIEAAVIKNNADVGS